MSFFYDGQDPEYDEELISRQNTTAILNVRDLCILMRHSRLSAQSAIGGGYEYNQLQLEIWFLEKIIRLLDKVLIDKFNTKDIQQFYNDAMSVDLGLDEIVPGKYFDKVGIFYIRYEILILAKKLFTNFGLAIEDDWKFL
ncbi:MAG: hypothetical protein JWR09_4393 [Mucilaginibacter sp.]|nr:hypothetical protein [Mucilaginibacter sp.]